MRAVAITEAAPQHVVEFAVDAPGTLLRDVAVSGLQAGERLTAIDVRPSTGRVVATSDAGRVLVLDPATGAVTPTFPAAFGAGPFGQDFDPVQDRLHSVDSAARHVSYDPVSGATAERGRLAYLADDAHAGDAPADQRPGVHRQLRERVRQPDARHRHGRRRAGRGDRRAARARADDRRHGRRRDRGRGLRHRRRRHRRARLRGARQAGRDALVAVPPEPRHRRRHARRRRRHRGPLRRADAAPARARRHPGLLGRMAGRRSRGRGGDDRHRPRHGLPARRDVPPARSRGRGRLRRGLPAPRRGPGRARPVRGVGGVRQRAAVGPRRRARDQRGPAGCRAGDAAARPSARAERPDDPAQRRQRGRERRPRQRGALDDPRRRGAPGPGHLADGPGLDRPRAARLRPCLRVAVAVGQRREGGDVGARARAGPGRRGGRPARRGEALPRRRHAGGGELPDPGARAQRAPGADRRVARPGDAPAQHPAAGAAQERGGLGRLLLGLRAAARRRERGQRAEPTASCSPSSTSPQPRR